MTTVKSVLVGVLLGAGVGGLLTACTSVPHGPAYADAELQAMCEREGGWWRGGLIPGFCESQSTTMP
jgi:hypothetical protein